MFFANAAHLAQEMGPLITEACPRVVALDLSGVLDVEYTAMKMLTQGAQRVRDRGLTVWLVGMNPRVLAMVKRSQLAAVVGSDAMKFNLEIAVAQYQSTATGD
jgi:anti-anti-sigma regulatory factor